MSKGKIAIRNLLTVVGALIAVMFLLWGLSTGWGKVKIQRMHTVAANGETYSCIMMVPENATAATPAPAVLITGGGDCNAYRQIYYAIEYARRGYVVLSLDQQGYGESDTPNMEATTPTVHYYEYLENCCDFVKKDSIILHAFSYGGMMSERLIAKYGVENIPLVITSVSARNVFGTNVLTVRMGVDMHTDDETLWSQIGDMYTARGIQSLAEIPNNEIIGSFEDRTGLVLVTQPNGTHTQSEYSKIAITAAMKYSNLAATAPVQIGEDNILLLPLIILNMMAMVLFYIMIPLIANALLQNIPFFTSMITERPANIGIKGVSWWVSALLAMVIPAAIFDPIFQRTFFSSGFLPLNVFKVWMTVCAGISLLFFVVSYVVSIRKKCQNPLVDYGFALQSNPKALPWAVIGKGLLLAIITMVTTFSLARWINNFTGLNITVLFAEIEPIATGRLLQSWKLLIPVFLFIVTFSVDHLVTRRLPEMKNENLTLIRDIIVNCLVGCAGILFVVVWYSVAWKTGIAKPWFNGGVCYLYTMPIVMLVVSTITTYLYRKTGTIWASIFTGGLYMLLSMCMSWR